LVVQETATPPTGVLARRHHAPDKDWCVETEERYFATNLLWNRLTPAQILLVVRNHWSVENDCFHSLDVQWGEDRPASCDLMNFDQVWEAADFIAQSGRRGENQVLDAVVIGAGPAGINTTLGLMAHKLRVELLEREAFGGTIRHYPRAKVVMTGQLDVPLFGQVKSRTMSKEELVELLHDIRRRTNPTVRTEECVTRIEPAGAGLWAVQSTSQQWLTANVVLALGVRGVPRQLGVPGEDLPQVAYRLMEPEQFACQQVLVVGGGNSAVESALALADAACCTSVTISYRRDTFARCRKENRERIASAIREGQVRPLFPSQVVEIHPDHVLLSHGQQQLALPNDSIIVQIGGTPPRGLLEATGVRMVTKFGEA
jgi:thioredoxin reductase